MWYEILPSIGIIFGAMYMGGMVSSWYPNLVYGKPAGLRQLIHPYEQQYYLRDQHITGHPYKLQGLEGIPDGDDDSSAK